MKYIFNVWHQHIQYNYKIKKAKWYALTSDPWNSVNFTCLNCLRRRETHDLVSWTLFPRLGKMMLAKALSCWWIRQNNNLWHPMTAMREFFQTWIRKIDFAATSLTSYQFTILFFKTFSSRGGFSSKVILCALNQEQFFILKKNSLIFVNCKYNSRQLEDFKVSKHKITIITAGRGYDSTTTNLEHHFF